MQNDRQRAWWKSGTVSPAWPFLKFERQLAAPLSDLDTKIGRLGQRSSEIQQELRNLIATVASSGPSPSLVDAINTREQELREISRALLGSGSESVTTHVNQARKFVGERLGNIRSLLASDVPKAKAELAKHVSGIAN